MVTSTSMAYFKNGCLIEVEAPTKPDAKPYVYLVVFVKPRVPRATRKRRNINEDDLRPIKILYDPYEDRWAYVQHTMGQTKVVNWPPRYKLTIEDRKILLAAIAKWAEQPTVD